MVQDYVFEAITREANCQPKEITLETRLGDLGIDSLRAITVLYELEEMLDIEIPNEVLDSLTNVGDIVLHLERIMQKSRAER